MQNEISFLLHLTKKLYKAPNFCSPSVSEVNIPNLLSVAIKNNMGYYAARELLLGYSNNLSSFDLSICKSMVEKGEKKLEQMGEVLKILNRTLNKYLVIKTYRAYPRIPNDIDVLSPDLSSSINALEEVGLRMHGYTSQDAMLLHGSTKVHLHGMITWAKEGTTFLDSEIMWERSLTVKLSEVEVQIPNYDAEFLTYLAHISYEPLHATLSDLLYIYRIASKVDWVLVREQANKHKWGRTLRNLVAMLDKMHHSIYLNPCPFLEFDLRHQGASQDSFITLPKSVPINYVMLGVIEKRLLLWVISKRLMKSSLVIVSGCSHRSFHTPPETRLLN